MANLNNYNDILINNDYNLLIEYDGTVFVGMSNYINSKKRDYIKTLIVEKININ